MFLQLPRIRRAAGTPLAAVLAAALALTLSGCHVPGVEKTLPAKQLKQELLTAPIGSKPYTGGTLAPGGILTLDQYVDGVFDVQYQADEKKSVTRDGFDYAVETNWDASDGSSADVFLLQFDSSAGAQDYVTSVSEGNSENIHPQEPLSSLQGIPGGEAWSSGTVDDDGDISQDAWFTVGDIAVDLGYYTAASAHPAELDQLARAQRARLVGQVTTPSPLPPPSDSAPPTPAGSASATAADKKRLLGDLLASPHGSRPWSTSKADGPTGILTLNQFLVRYGDTAADRQLEDSLEKDRGFQYAVRKSWVAKNGTQADIHLIQFASATGAQSFTLGYQRSGQDNVGSKGTYTVPASGDAKAYQRSGLNSDGYILTESYFVVGNVAVNVDFWVAAKANRSDVIDLVEKQRARLMDDPTLAAAAAAAPALPTSDS
jgi:hypothetical protein